MYSLAANMLDCGPSPDNLTLSDHTTSVNRSNVPFGEAISTIYNNIMAMFYTTRHGAYVLRLTNTNSL